MGSRMSFGGPEPQGQRRKARREGLPRADGRGRAMGQVARPGGPQLPFPGARQACARRGDDAQDVPAPGDARPFRRGSRGCRPGFAGDAALHAPRPHAGAGAGRDGPREAPPCPRGGGRRVLPCGPRPHGRGGAPRGRLRPPSLPDAPDHRQEALRHRGPGLRAPGREGHRVQEGIRPLRGGASLPHREAPVRAPEDALQRGPEELLHALRILRPRRSRRAHPGGQVPRLPPRSCLRGSGTPCRMPSRVSVRTRAAAAPEGH